MCDGEKECGYTVWRVWVGGCGCVVLIAHIEWRMTKYKTVQMNT